MPTFDNEPWLEDTPAWLHPIYRKLGLKTRFEKQKEYVKEVKRKAGEYILLKLDDLEQKVNDVLLGKLNKWYFQDPEIELWPWQVDLWPGRFPAECEKRIRKRIEEINAINVDGILERPLVPLQEYEDGPEDFYWHNEEDLAREYVYRLKCAALERIHGDEYDDTPRWLFPIYKLLGRKTKQEIRQGEEKFFLKQFDIAEKRLAEVLLDPEEKNFWLNRHLMFYDFDIWPGRFSREGEKVIREKVRQINQKAEAEMGRPVIEMREHKTVPLVETWKRREKRVEMMSRPEPDEDKENSPDLA